MVKSNQSGLGPDLVLVAPEPEPNHREEEIDDLGGNFFDSRQITLPLTTF